MENIGLHYCSKFGENLTTFGGVMIQKPPKSPQKWHFWLLGKQMNIDNLATTNGILMKLTMIMYSMRPSFGTKLGPQLQEVRGRSRKTPQKCHKIDEPSTLTSPKNGLKKTMKVGFVLLSSLTI